MSVPLKQTITGKVYSVTGAKHLYSGLYEKQITVVNDYSSIIDK
jgi:hypothetical protein